MLIQTTSKIDCIKAFINTWLKDPRKYCERCGVYYCKGESCCERPLIVDNFQLVYLAKIDNKKIQQTRHNEFASTKDKNIRLTVSIPPKLLTDLESYFQKYYQEKLFETKEEVYKFMKAFPVFCVPQRI